MNSKAFGPEGAALGPTQHFSPSQLCVERYMGTGEAKGCRRGPWRVMLSNIFGDKLHT